MTAGPSEDEICEPVDQALLDKAVEALRSVLKGNGVNPEDITLQEFEGEVFCFEAYTIFKISPRVGEKTLPGRERGEVVGSLTDARARMQAAANNISVDPEVRELGRSGLEKRDDLGFAVSNLSFRIDRLKRQFVVHSSCGTCGGDGLLACGGCRGSGHARCGQCQGKRDAICNACAGHGFVSTPEGRHQCAPCSGRGRIACRTCNQTGEVTCPQCQGSGQTRCAQCKATGWISTIFFLTFDIRNRFEFDKEGLPEEVPPLIEALGPEMVTDGHAEVVIVKDKEREKIVENDSKPDELVILYDVRLPWGDLDFSLRDKSLKAKLFGYQPELVDLPPIIEKTAGGGIAALKKAAQKNGGDPVKAIQKGARYRIIGEALFATARYRKKQALGYLNDKYHFGIRENALKALVTFSDHALKNVTRKARAQGLMGGLVLTAALYALYHIGPVRSLLAGVIEAPAALGAIDALVIVLGTIITTAGIRYTGIKALHNALGPLIPDEEKKKVVPKSGESAIWGGLGGIILYLVMIEGASLLGQPLPSWYETIRALLIP